MSQRRIFIECTHTYRYGGNTGIQRVVRNLANTCRAVGRRLGVECAPVVVERDRFYEVDAVTLEPHEPFDVEREPGAERVIRQTARKVIFKLPGGWRIEGAIEKGLVPAAGAIPRWIRRRQNPEVNPRAGDLFMLADSSWNEPIWTAVQRARQQGAVFGQVLYDLMPLTHGFCYTDPLIRAFRQWFVDFHEHASFLVAISRSTRDEYLRYIEAGLADVPAGALPGGAFRLGNDMDRRTTATASASIIDAFEDHAAGPPFLVVGTFAPYKNQAVVLDAFERLWSQGLPYRLCFIGKRGWQYDELLARVDGHAERGRRLFVFHDADDADLAYAYRRARGLITASVIEGFNLPLAEALNHGLPVLASNIAVHREVAGSLCQYFDPASPQALAMLVRRQCEQPQAAPDPRDVRFALPDWARSTEEFLRLSMQLAGESAATRIPAPPAAPAVVTGR